MARKAAWMLVLLAALLVISASAAWASSVTRSPQSSLSSSGNAAVVKLGGTAGTPSITTGAKLKLQGRCNHGDNAAADEAAY